MIMDDFFMHSTQQEILQFLTQFFPQSLAQCDIESVTEKKRVFIVACERK